jgi:peptide chain release factor
MKKESAESVTRRLQKLGIKPGDLEEKFILGSGSGGQNLQKTASCVWLKHITSGIEVKCQKSRSRAQNRTFARHQLCDALEKRELQNRLREKAELAKISRKKRKRSKAQKAQLVEHKRHISKKKSLRKTALDD